MPVHEAPSGTQLDQTSAILFDVLIDRVRTCDRGVVAIQVNRRRHHSINPFKRDIAQRRPIEPRRS
jgi:hypothetical protein